MVKTKAKKNTKKKNTTKKKYKVRNWPEYNQMLVDRGRIDVWIEKGLLEQWYNEASWEKKKKRGAPKTYSDLSIAITLQFGQVFHQRLRQIEGLLQSVFTLMGIELKVPDFTTLSRRGEVVPVILPKETRDTVDIVLDSSGLKVYGEGEWKVRKHGWGKHRTWMKIHLMMTPDGEIREAELTPNHISDDEVAPVLLDKEGAVISKVAGDRAYDKRKVYQVCQEKQIETIAIPPRKNARIWIHGNSRQGVHPRDENLRIIRSQGRKAWKKQAGYHVRSMGENVYYRWKTILGDKLNARKFSTQRTEARIKAALLNRMRLLGMPESYAVT